MLIGLLSDAHGNDNGIDRCLKVLRRLGAGQVYFLGDSVGYLPQEAAVLERLRAERAICLRGNHEEMLLGNLPLPEVREREYRLKAARTRLRHSAQAYIETWPTLRETTIDGAKWLLVHGHPLQPTVGYLYPDADLAPLSDLPFDFVFCGHTHRPFVRRAGAVTVVNVGSCGLPRDVGNLASCVIYNTESREAEVLRVPFDAEGLIMHHGSELHESVIACLRRRPTQAPFGRRIDVASD